MPMKPLIIIVAATIPLVSTKLVQAQTACDDPYTTDWDLVPMDIWLNTNTDMLCEWSSCNSLNDVKWSIRASLTEYFSNGNSNFRAEFIDTTSMFPGDAIPEAVHVAGDSYCPGNMKNQYIAAHMEVSGSYRAKWIFLCRQNDLGILNWQTMSNANSGIDFQNVFLHELGHAIGMLHTDECNSSPWPKSIMYPGTVDGADHLYKVDIEYLRDRFTTAGSRHVNRYSDETPDGLTYTSNYGGLTLFRNRFVATTTVDATLDSLVNYVAYGTGYYNDRAIAFARFSQTNGWDWVAEIPGAQTLYHPGIATNNLGDVQIAFLTNYDESSGEQDVRLATSINRGDTWSCCSMLPGEQPRARGNGIYSTYDPESGEYMYVWRDDGENEIHYKIGGGDVKVLVGLSAADTPSISCGEETELGTIYNCMMAWPDATDWTRHVRWTQFYVAGSQIITADIHTLGYVSTGSAVVTYLGDVADPWLIALNQDGDVTYTWHKGPYEFDNWRDWRGIVHPERTTIPALGSIHPIGSYTTRAILYVGSTSYVQNP